IGSLLDDEEDLPLLHRLAFIEGARLEKALDARPDVDRVDGLDPSDELGAWRYFLDGHLHYADDRRRRLGEGRQAGKHACSRQDAEQPAGRAACEAGYMQDVSAA